VPLSRTLSRAQQSGGGRRGSVCMTPGVAAAMLDAARSRLSSPVAYGHGPASPDLVALSQAKAVGLHAAAYGSASGQAGSVSGQHDGGGHDPGRAAAARVLGGAAAELMPDVSRTSSAPNMGA
jgi:hypothetical protein